MHIDTKIDAYIDAYLCINMQSLIQRLNQRCIFVSIFVSICIDVCILIQRLMNIDTKIDAYIDAQIQDWCIMHASIHPYIHTYIMHASIMHRYIHIHWCIHVVERFWVKRFGAAAARGTSHTSPHWAQRQPESLQGGGRHCYPCRHCFCRRCSAVLQALWAHHGWDCRSVRSSLYLCLSLCLTFSYLSS